MSTAQAVQQVEHDFGVVVTGDIAMRLDGCFDCCKQASSLVAAFELHPHRPTHK